MSLIYQLTAYDWSSFNWENKKVSKVTGSRVNHVGLRVNGMEIYANLKGASLVPYNRIERMFNKPLFLTPAVVITDRSLWNMCGPIVNNYKSISPWYIMLYYYTGRLLPTPPSCTHLVQQCLRTLGVNVNESFYPNDLIKEYYRCT